LSGSSETLAFGHAQLYCSKAARAAPSGLKGPKKSRLDTPDRRSLHRVRCEVLIETRHYFSHGSLHVSIESRYNGGHILSADWLVVRVIVRPDCSASIEVAHLEF